MYSRASLQIVCPDVRINIFDFLFQVNLLFISNSRVLPRFSKSIPGPTVKLTLSIATVIGTLMLTKMLHFPEFFQSHNYCHNRPSVLFLETARISCYSGVMFDDVMTKTLLRTIKLGYCEQFCHKFFF